MLEMKCVSLSLMVALAVMGCNFGVAIGGCHRPPVIFSFGDSNADTGGLFAGLGYSLNPPNGRSFFGRPSGRLSDGRLILDFLCKFAFSYFKLLITPSVLHFVLISRMSIQHSNIFNYQ